jgi:transposase-like protein
VITDKLASYPPAIRRVLPNTEHRRHKRLNYRARTEMVANGAERSRKALDVLGGFEPLKYPLAPRVTSRQTA